MKNENKTHKLKQVTILALDNPRCLKFAVKSAKSAKNREDVGYCTDTCLDPLIHIFFLFEHPNQECCQETTMMRNFNN